MKKYTLTLWMLGGAFPQSFHAPSDGDATWFARGFIAAYIERDEEAYVGAEFQLDEDQGAAFDDATFVGKCLIESRDGKVGQQWKTVVRRRPRSTTDFDVGDPHDQ